MTPEGVLSELVLEYGFWITIGGISLYSLLKGIIPQIIRLVKIYVDSVENRQDCSAKHDEIYQRVDRRINTICKKIDDLKASLSRIQKENEERDNKIFDHVFGLVAEVKKYESEFEKVKVHVDQQVQEGRKIMAQISESRGAGRL